MHHLKDIFSILLQSLYTWSKQASGYFASADTVAPFDQQEKKGSLFSPMNLIFVLEYVHVVAYMIKCESVHQRTRDCDWLDSKALGCRSLKMTR